MEVPSTNNIQFHGIETVTNLQDTDHTVTKTPKFQIAEIPFAIQVDDIKSLFLQVCEVLVESISMPLFRSKML